MFYTLVGMMITDAPDPPSHRTIIDRAGGPAAVGHRIGVDPNTTKGWKRLNSIPAAYWHDLASAGVADLEELAIAAARRACLTINDGEPGTWKDALAHSPNLRVEDYVPKEPVVGSPEPGPAPGWALSDAELDTLARDAAAEPAPVVICDVCEARLDRDLPKACTFVDCPHAVRNAA